MDIIIKQKFSKIKKVYEEEQQVEKPYLDVFFDVVTENGSWIDKDGTGYFPIEIEDKKQSDEDLKKECADWINKHTVLSHYKPVNVREALIQAKLREMAEKELIAEGKITPELNG